MDEPGLFGESEGEADLFREWMDWYAAHGGRLRGEPPQAIAPAAAAEKPVGPGPCPVCGGEMARRTGKYGPFYGCRRFPDCRGIRKVKEGR